MHASKWSLMFKSSRRTFGICVVPAAQLLGSKAHVAAFMWAAHDWAVDVLPKFVQ